MAGLLTYTLFEGLPIRRPAVSDIQDFKKLWMITAAGTVAEFPDANLGITAFPFQTVPFEQRTSAPFMLQQK